MHACGFPVDVSVLLLVTVRARGTEEKQKSGSKCRKVQFNYNKNATGKSQAHVVEEGLETEAATGARVGQAE